MAGQLNTDRINQLEKQTATHEERIDNLRNQVLRLEQSDLDTRLTSALRDLEQEQTGAIHELDKRLAIASENIARLERRFDELLKRRWDLLKLLIAAVLGAIASDCFEVAKQWLSRGTTVQTISTGQDRETRPGIGKVR